MEGRAWSVLNSGPSCPCTCRRTRQDITDMKPWDVVRIRGSCPQPPAEDGFPVLLKTPHHWVFLGCPHRLPPELLKQGHAASSITILQMRKQGWEKSSLDLFIAETAQFVPWGWVVGKQVSQHTGEGRESKERWWKICPSHPPPPPHPPVSRGQHKLQSQPCWTEQLRNSLECLQTS